MSGRPRAFGTSICPFDLGIVRVRIIMLRFLEVAGEMRNKRSESRLTSIVLSRLLLNLREAADTDETTNDFDHHGAASLTFSSVLFAESMQTCQLSSYLSSKYAEP